MDVLALIPYMQGWTPGQRTSIELWERILEPSGIHLHYVPFETDRLHQVLYKTGEHITKTVEMIKAYVRRLKLLDKLNNYDVVYIYREAALLGPAVLEKWIHRSGKPIIYHLDDPLYIPYRSQANGYLSYLKCFWKVADICRISQAVIVNSSSHKQYALKYNRNVWQIPSIVDVNRHIYTPQSFDIKEIGVGWIGSPHTTGNLKVISKVLQELAKKVEFQFHTIGAKDFDLSGVSYSNHLWQEETEVEILKKIQIGVAPLLMTEWNKRKFIFKVVQYMAMGIPPVCTPLGSNPEVVEHGVTGFLAESHEEWIHYLEILIRDVPLRLKMSQEAARVARENYSLDANAERIVQAFRSVLKRPGLV